MILDKGLTFYHGSYTEVRNIDLDKSESGKDFGKGFYLTSNKAIICAGICGNGNLAIISKDKSINKFSDLVARSFRFEIALLNT